jgi:hypothetical protein
MLNIFWLHVKNTFNVVQNTLVYINCLGTPHEITKLQLISQLNEHTSLCLDEKSKKVINIEGCTT